MKEFFEIIKKLWLNKRTRAIAILILYAIFFFFVYLVLNSEKPTKPVETIVKYNLEFIGDYNFEYVDGKYLYDGQIFDQKPIDIEVDIFNSNNIDKVINQSILESINYIDNIETHLINSNLFESIMELSSKNLNLDIRIKVYKKNNKIEIDLNEYNGYTVIMKLGVN